MSLNKQLYLLLFLCLSVAFSASAQKNLETFGKNRIQYRGFNWRYYSTTHFDIYFYNGGQKLAKHTAEMLEDEYGRITDIMGYAPYIKTKIFIYNSHIDFDQSNVGIKEKTFDIGGQTNFLKTHIEIPFEGEISQFEDDLIYKVSRLFVDDMMFGGLITEVFQSTYLFTLPEWFIDGIAAYIAYGWDIEMDDYVRSYLRTNNANKLDKLEGKEAKLAGQSVWNFISEKYGRINISNILNLTRIVRNVEKGVTNTLGIPYKAFIDEYRYFYLNTTSDENLSATDRNNLLLKAKEGHVYNAKISPNGDYLAYYENDRGKYKVYVKDLNTGKSKTILKGGDKRVDKDFNKNIPIIDWGDSATLGVIYSERGFHLMNLYNPYSNESQLRDLRRFDQVNHLDIYPNGKTAVISANEKGQSDLYLISTYRPNTRRLTNDVFDDVYPAFIPDTKKIVFSSNRGVDSISLDYKYNEAIENYNLFEYDIDSSRNTVKRITNDIGKNIHVVSPSSDAIYFLSDKSGIYNIYKMRLSDSLVTQYTSYKSSLINFDVRPDKNLLTYTTQEDGLERLSFVNNFESTGNAFTPSTLRKQVLLSRKLNEEKAKRNQEKRKENGQISAISDSISVKPDSSSLSDKLNADDFNFEVRPTDENKTEQSSLLKNLRKLRQQSTLIGPLEYEPTFTADNVITSWVIDPLIGFSPFLEYQMNDLMENNRFTGGFLISTDFRSGKIFGEYQYLPKLIDYSIRFDRTSYHFNFFDDNNIDVSQKYAYNQLTFGFSYPLSVTSRISFKPHVGLKEFTETSQSLLNNPNIRREKSPLQRNFMTGGRIEFVFDNSIPKGLNIREGLRAKVAIENFTDVSDYSKSFNKFFIDIRNYQKLYRGITFTSRAYVGSFFGNNTPSFMLGGVNNWLFRRTNNPVGNEVNAANNPLELTSTLNPEDNSNILFHEFVTGLRGFRLNELNGSNVMLLSNELRIPLFRTLSSGAISAAIIRNFQLVGFYDIGTAWFGGSPWDQENSINKQTINSGAFNVVIRNYKNPWLSSLGFGVRTTVFGYYVKLDYSYPIEDYQIQSPNLSISLGYDF